MKLECHINQRNSVILLLIILSFLSDGYISTYFVATLFPEGALCITFLTF